MEEYDSREINEAIDNLVAKMRDMNPDLDLRKAQTVIRQTVENLLKDTGDR